MRTWLLAGLLLLGVMAMAIAGEYAPPAPAEVELEGNSVVAVHEGGRLEIPLRCPGFTFNENTFSGSAEPLAVTGDLESGLEVYYPAMPLPFGGSLLAHSTLTWSPAESALRKWTRYALSDDAPSNQLVRDIVMWTQKAPGARWHPGLPYSYPVFIPGVFCGIEYPAATTRIEGDLLVLSQTPGKRLVPGEWYETHKAVWGFTPLGQEQASFKRYLMDLRRQRDLVANRREIMFDYNTWWTEPVPFTSDDLVKLAGQLETGLGTPEKAYFDLFTLDMGWSDTHSIWQLDPKGYPRGLAPVRAAARRLGAGVGIWMSPSSAYPGALDNKWAIEQGFESLPAPWMGEGMLYLCQAGPKYRAAWQAQLVNLIRNEDVKQFKFDGFHPYCPETGHGHEPDPLASEALIDAYVAMCELVRATDSDVWIEPYGLGYCPSPWWLLWADCALGTHGDDAPPGRVPSPVWKESLTSGRDFFVLQGSYWSSCPNVTQEAIGLVNQNAEPFLNDAVVTCLRGNQYIAPYLNPKYMDETRWGQLGALMNWTRAHWDLLEETVPLLPLDWQEGNCPYITSAPAMPRQPYGYAHFKGDEGLVLLRNPWLEEATYSLPLDESVGLSPDAKGLVAVGVYPEARLYGNNLSAGGKLEVPLAPYETLVLRLAPAKTFPTANLAGPPAQSAPALAQVTSSSVRKLKYTTSAELTADSTPLLTADGAIEFALDASVTVSEGIARLLVLTEGSKPVDPPLNVELTVDGKPVATRLMNSASGWTATGLPRAENWAFLIADMPAGKHQVSLKFLTSSDLPPSIWLWSTRGKPAEPRDFPELMPAPEEVSLGSVKLLSFTQEQLARVPIEEVERPVERINGVFLDTLEPVKSVQNWGILQRNQSVWEKPLLLGGKRFVRGLGTHANAELVWNLEGRYRRFQTWVGSDGNYVGTVTFELWVDGVKRAATGLVNADMAPKHWDVDVTGARELKVIVTDGGDGIPCDHADLCDAKLLF